MLKFAFLPFTILSLPSLPLLRTLTKKKDETLFTLFTIPLLRTLTKKKEPYPYFLTVPFYHTLFTFFTKKKEPFLFLPLTPSEKKRHRTPKGSPLRPCYPFRFFFGTVKRGTGRGLFFLVRVRVRGLFCSFLYLRASGLDGFTLSRLQGSRASRLHRFRT